MLHQTLSPCYSNTKTIFLKPEHFFTKERISNFQATLFSFYRNNIFSARLILEILKLSLKINGYRCIAR